MLTITTDDIDFLKRIRGRFVPTKREDFPLLFNVLLMGICIPISFSFILLHDGIPKWPLDGDHWALVVMTVSSFLLGWLFWNIYGSEYEFTDTGVILWRRGRKKREILFSEVEKIDVHSDQRAPAIILEANGRRFRILLHQSLKTYINQMNIEQAASPL